MEQQISDKHITMTSSGMVRDICNPLFESFNLNHFFYLKLYNDGQAVILTTSPKYLQQITSKKTHSANNIIEKINPGYYLWDHFNHNMPSKIAKKLEAQLTIAKKDFNIHNGLMIVGKPTERYVEICDIASPKQNTHAKNFYLNNQELIYRFINHFKDKGGDLLKVAEKSKLTIYKPTEVTEISKDKNQIFLQNTKARNLIVNNNMQCRLPKRELECFIYTLHGKTALEISEIISISPKTAEGYISNVKNKLGCRSRSELFEIAINLGLIKIADYL